MSIGHVLQKKKKKTQKIILGVVLANLHTQRISMRTYALKDRNGSSRSASISLGSEACFSFNNELKHGEGT